MGMEMWEEPVRCHRTLQARVTSNVVECNMKPVNCCKEGSDRINSAFNIIVQLSLSLQQGDHLLIRSLGN